MQHQGVGSIGFSGGLSPQSVDVSFSLCASVYIVVFLSLIRTLVFLDQCLTVMTLFDLNYILKGSISKCSHDSNQ